jgi:hypothetical protein
MTRSSIAIAALVPVCLGLFAPGVASQAIPSVQQSPIQQSRAWTSGPLITETRTDLIVVGAADSATAAQARTSALENAVYRTAVEITNRLFAEQNLPLTTSLDSLSAFVRRVSRIVDQVETPTTTGYQGRTRLQLNKTFLDRLTITRLTPPARPEAFAVGYLLLPASRGKAGSISGRAPVRAASAGKGNFTFAFNIRPAGAGTLIKLESIDVIEDGSAGATRWAFDVTVNRRPAFTVAAAQYDDRVRTYAMSSGNRPLEFTFNGTEPYVEVRVTGTKP